MSDKIMTLADYDAQERTVFLAHSKDDEAETGLGWYWEAGSNPLSGRVRAKSFATREEAAADAKRFNNVIGN